jgi:hypothetical protein
MMDGMMGVSGAHMVIWGIVGILLIVLLVVLIARLIKEEEEFPLCSWMGHCPALVQCLQD